MTRRGKLQTLEMAISGDHLEENFDGLMEDGFSVQGWDNAENLEEEEDFDYVAPTKNLPKKKSTKPHILDRKDKVIYGGWLRHFFYKEHGGKKPQILTNDPSASEVSCRDCSTVLAGTLDKTNLFGSLHFSEIYFRSQDEFNRELPELTLSLLQLFDWVGTCSCGEVHYGYLKIVDESTLPSEPVVEEPKVEVSSNEPISEEIVSEEPAVEEPVAEEPVKVLSLQERVQQFASRAESMTAKPSEETEVANTSTSRKKKLKVQQLSLFDFLGEEEQEAVLS